MELYKSIMNPCNVFIIKEIMEKLLLLTTILLGLVRILVAMAEQSSEKEPPNVIIFLVDDLGYGDLSPYGHPTSNTPHIQRLANEGLLFTQFYVTSPVGSPSRAALLTGRFQTRSGIYPGVFSPDDLGGLPSDEITIAESLREMGYATGMVGKWQLGVGENGTHLPSNHGFDYYMGIPYSHSDCPCYICFYPNQMCHQMCDPEFVPCPIMKCTNSSQDILEQPADLTSLSKNMLNAAISFIEDSKVKKKPFFLYYSFHHTHGPHFSGKKFRNSSIRGPFGDSLREVDYSVGLVMQSLRNNDLYKNTFVLLTSDNGPDLSLSEEGGSAGLLRCGKGSTWEGGVRVPAIAWWPNNVIHFRTHSLVSSVDIFPTIMEIVGGKVPQDRKMDGVDISNVLTRKRGKSARDWLPYFPEAMNETEGPHAMRWKQYKAHYYTKGAYCPEDYHDSACRSNTTLQYHNPPLLFNLHSDPGEHFPLDSDEYSLVIERIGLIRQNMMYSLEWGESQTEMGESKEVEPCSQSECDPFPYCCEMESQMNQYKTPPFYAL